MVATEKKNLVGQGGVLGSLGNMLEWFDYGLYGYFAAIISADFVADDPIVGLCSASWSSERLSSGPIGGILIGAYADKHGRIKALTLTILCMGVCTMLMDACLRNSRWYFYATDPAHGAALRCRAWRREANLAFADVHLGIRDAEQPGFCSWQPFSVGCGLLWAPLPVCSSRRSCPKPLCND